MKKLSIALFLFLISVSLWAGGEQEAAASAVRGKYLAGQGIIIPPGEVHINSYIAQIDYHYPDPVEALGINLYSGHYQLYASGQEEVIHIGIQGRKLDFEDLPPMNLAFVIDKSGSMAAEEKMDWVKDAFDIFIEKVRDIDFVSLVVFDNDAGLVFPTTRMSSRDRRLEFKRAVNSVEPGGGTNLMAGLELGYQQVMANYRSEYTNRVLFLTDGVGESQGILEMAETYKDMDINVSTIGVGTDFDLNLMVDIAKRGGGSSRFISDREEMEETFGSELDRMVVPVARNLSMKLELLQPAEVLETWGYNNQVRGNTILYSQDTLHHRDYETILARVCFREGTALGNQEIARFSIEYNDLNGNAHISGPHVLRADFVDKENPVTGFTSGMVLQSGTMMRFAKSLLTIGELYYSCRAEISEINNMKDSLWREGGAESYDMISSPEIMGLEEAVAAKMRRAVEITSVMKKELINTKLRLDNEGFDDEITIMEHYIRILGQDLEWAQPKMQEVLYDREIAPQVRERPLEEHLENLFREMTCDLKLKDRGVVAISGFIGKTGESSGLTELLNEMAVTEIGKIDTLTLVERERLGDLLVEQNLSLSGLTDTSTAIEIGRLLSASYLITGSVIEMESSVVIFGRIINVESGEIESAAQVIVPRDRDIRQLL